MLLCGIKVDSNKDKDNQCSTFFSALFFCAVMSDHGISKAQTVHAVQVKHQMKCDVWNDAGWHVRALHRKSQALQGDDCPPSPTLAVLKTTVSRYFLTSSGMVYNGTGLGKAGWLCFVPYHSPPHEHANPNCCWHMPFININIIIISG